MPRNSRDDDDEVTGPQGRRRRRGPDSLPPVWQPTPSFPPQLPARTRPPLQEDPPEEAPARAVRARKTPQAEAMEELGANVAELTMVIAGHPLRPGTGLIAVVEGARTDAGEALQAADLAAEAAQEARDLVKERDDDISEMLERMAVIIDRTQPRDGFFARLLSPAVLKYVVPIVAAVVPVALGIVGLAGTALGLYLAKSEPAAIESTHQQAGGAHGGESPDR